MKVDLDKISIESLKEIIRSKEKEKENKTNNLIPDCIKFEYIRNSIISLQFGNNQSLFYNESNKSWNVYKADNHYLQQCELVEVDEEDLEIGKFYFCSDEDSLDDDCHLDDIGQYRLYIGKNKFIVICCNTSVVEEEETFEKYYEVIPMED